MTARLHTIGSLLFLSCAATVVVGCGDSDDDGATVADSGSAQDSAVADSASTEDSGTPADSGVSGDADVASDGSSDASITPGPFDLNLNGTVYSMLHAGNSWYLGGAFTAMNTTPARALLPLTTAGMPVTTCNLEKGFLGQVSAILRAGNSIYVGGSFVTYQGKGVNRIAKLDAATCALDTTFSPANPGFDSNVLALATAGNSLYVGGAFSSYRGVPNSAFRLAKLDLTTGAIDTTFSPVGANANGFETNVYALATAGTSLYVGGTFNAYKGVYYNAMYLAKLDQTTGALDTTFSPNGLGNNGFNGTVYTLAVSGTSLYAGGTFTKYRNVADSANRIAKLDLTTGARDTSFSPTGAGANGFDNVVYALAASGTSLYAGGAFTAYRSVANSALGLAKLDLATGALDATFSPSGTGGFNAVTAVALSGTDVIVGGAFESYKGAAYSHVAKLNGTTGAADTTFGSNGGTLRGVDRDVTAILVDGSTVWLGGYFRHYGGNVARHIAKLNDVTYALDTTFTPAVNGGFDDEVYSVATSGNSLYVGGRFNAYRGVADSAHRIAKLDLTTGALDTTFSPATNGFNNDVWVLTATPTAVFAGGGFTAYRDVPGSANRIAKLDATSGALDATFSPATNGFNDWVYALAVSGSALYVGGEFSAYRGVSDISGLAKLDTTTGVLDTTFSPAGAGNNGVNGTVLSLAVNGDAVFVGGDFGWYRGVPNSALRLAKVNATTGALDTTFTMPGASGGFDGDVRALAVSGTSLFVGGNFSSYRGVTNAANGIAKLDLMSGALDTTFSPPGATANGFDDGAYTLTPYQGSIFAAGDFTAYRGSTPLFYAAKLDATNGAKQ